MAVNIDTVYQKVLALANKEQRGYITPQDFNLFANQAQLEIFEQYFYDINQARKSQGNDTVIADIDDILEDKLRIFESSPKSTIIATWINAPGGGKVIPNEVHRISHVGLKNSSGECEMLNTRDYINNKKSPLTSPSVARPIANLQGKVLKCNDGGSSDLPPFNVTYIRTPNKVNWTYAVINKRAMYNATPTTAHFELHPSEEIQLVNKILRLAGLATQQVDVMRAGGAMESMIKQQQSKI